MLGLNEQLKHYQAVKQRIAANGRPEYDRPLQVLPRLSYQPPVARMRVPTVAELDAELSIQKIGKASVPPTLLMKVKADKILREVALKHAVTIADIRGPRRFIPLMRARREAMYRLHHEMSWSQIRVANYLNKDHSSVHHALGAYERDLQNDLARTTDPQPLPEHGVAAD